MADDRLKEYRKTMEQIEVPEELKVATIAKMKAQKTIKRSNSVPYVAAAACAVVVLGSTYLYSGKTDRNEIMLAQSLEADVVVEEVALSEGSLYFEKVPGQFKSPGFQLGIMEGEMVSIDEEAYLEYLGTNPLPDNLVDGMTKQESEVQTLIRDADGNYTSDCFTITYADHEDRSLEIVLSKLEIPNEEESEELVESKIGKTPVKISYYGKEDATVFTAYFKVNEIGFKVKGNGMTQEEFIEILLEMVQKV